MKSIVLSLLLLATPVFAQESEEVDIDQLDQCASLSINYALFVLTANDAKTEQEFKEFVESQIKKQSDQSEEAIAAIRNFGRQAWEERKISPTSAGLALYQQCVRTLIGHNEPAAVTKQTT